MNVGTIEMFGGENIPSDYLECDGAAVSRTTYSDLFDAIGITWGAGDGSTTFNLPDLRGRSPLGDGTGVNIEKFNPNNIDTTYYIITVGWNDDRWLTGMQVRFTTTNTLPYPLVAGVDYWVIRLGSNIIALATTLANALIDNRLNITSQGTGVHTIIMKSLSDRSLANIGGEEQHILKQAEIPFHKHYLDRASTTGGGSVNRVVDGSSLDAETSGYGGEDFHNTMHPFAVVKFIIRCI